MVRILVVLLVCTVPAANAEIIEFDMTGLVGSSTDSVKVDSLVYYGPLAYVNSVSFRVTGIVDDLGEVCCGLPEDCPGASGSWFMTWWGAVEHVDDPDPVHGKWVASSPEYLSQIAPFDQIGFAENQNSFQSLTDGDVFNVELYFGKGGWPQPYECEVIRPTAGTMYSVKVILDVSSTLPVQSTTWGRVKTLFN